MHHVRLIVSVIFPVLCLLHNVQVFSIDAACLKGDWNGVMPPLSYKDIGNTIIHVASAMFPKETRTPRKPWSSTTLGRL